MYTSLCPPNVVAADAGWAFGANCIWSIHTNYTLGSPQILLSSTKCQALIKGEPLDLEMFWGFIILESKRNQTWTLCNVFGTCNKTSGSNSITCIYTVYFFFILFSVWHLSIGNFTKEYFSLSVTLTQYNGANLPEGTLMEKNTIRPCSPLCPHWHAQIWIEF